MCNKCEDAGKRRGRHSALIPALPLVKCNRYHELDHISKNYTNPRGCPFRVHLVSTFSFHAFAAHPCYGIISFRISIYFTFGWSSFPCLRSGGGYHCRLRFSPPPPPLSPCPLSSRVHLVSTLLFMRSPHTLATVQISFPCFSVFSFRVVFCLLVYISFQLSFPCVRRTPLLRYKVRFRVSVYFPFGWSSRPMGDPAEGSAKIYDYFFESVFACRLCKTQRGPSLA